MFVKTAVGAALAALTFAATPALAAGSIGGPMVGTSPSGSSTLYTFDVTGISSFDGEGAAGNTVATLNIGAGSEVIGIGWDVTINAISPSYLSEAVLSFGSTSTLAVFLTVGLGDDAPGIASYSSGGVVDLVGLGFNFTVDGDGQVRMEFFEDFDDLPGEADAIWQSGTLTLEVAAVPEPTTYGMMALGLLGVAAAARRSRKA
jgi:PEP-CTERM motif